MRTGKSVDPAIHVTGRQPCEKKIFSGVLFNPGDPELKAIKLRSHELSLQYSATGEDENRNLRGADPADVCRIQRRQLSAGAGLFFRVFTGICR